MLRARIPTSLTAAPDKAALTYRSFSIQGKQAATLLSRRLKVPVTEDHPASKGLAVLVHADRRPQTIETNGEERTFFGPSLIVKSLAEYSRAGRSEAGDIGLLGLTQARLMGRANNKSRRPRLKQSPLPSATEDAQKSAISRLLTRDGIWFTLFVHDAGDDGISISFPYLEFDDYAVHRMPEDIQALHKAQKRDSNTAQATDGGLFYIKLHNGGNIGSFGYGAGNAMATMDGLALAGGKPANFLDGGGGANRENSRLAIETLNRDPDVKSIFVNTFGGITQTDVVADGIIDAIRANNMKQPVVVRVKGTGAEEAKRKLRESGLAITIEDDFKKAARLAVEQAEAASASASP